ncbi:hypothetical protein B5E60_08465 [Alistipes sp. An116]|uniref:IS66 family transposase n=1 Tax=Alistipes sp. An116 TaxID=1965546 RepID=UPI000B36F4EC|nr:transposase [Alistipes sp. An116]OUQ53203.1 hypothetical protein B5E60_08465 [Alistipes sp. An116]
MGKCYKFAYMALFSYLQVLKTEEKQVVMTVEEQLAAALAEMENLRMAIAEKDCLIQDLQNKLLYDILRRQILSSEYIQIDESVMPVIDNEKHKARKGYEWCVRDAVSGDVIFYYDRGSRGHHVAREILSRYRGNAQCDGYEAYDQFEKMLGITVYGCWAHVRRKFVDSLKENERLAMEGILYKKTVQGGERCGR